MNQPNVVDTVVEVPSEQEPPNEENWPCLRMTVKIGSTLSLVLFAVRWYNSHSWR